ncbi:MAG: helix-turn-helix domain-containing protein [Acidimicrobiales bacterium]
MQVDDPRGRMRRQARALGDPTRHLLFQRIATADEPPTVAELVVLADVHPSAVRQHLAKLVDAELVVARPGEATGRGRPAQRYVPAPGAAARWAGAPDPYEQLAVLLGEAVRTGDGAFAVGRRHGAALGATVEAAPGSSPADAALGAIAREMDRQGFAPVLRAGGDGVAVELHACPFAQVVASEAEAVCALHHGIAVGVAEATGAVEVIGIEPGLPPERPCLLRVRERPTDDRST